MRVLAPPTPEERQLVHRAESRRLALSGDQSMLRQRYEEIMRWINPPWDPISKRVDPRPEDATIERSGIPKTHIDLVGPTVDRWAALQAGEAPIIRVQAPYVSTPVREADPDADMRARRLYDIDRSIAQNKSDQMENQTNIWAEECNLHRVLYQTVWCKGAFGKGVIRSGWDPDTKLPTAECMENPSQVYYGWSKRYGRRKLAWASVIEEISPYEANRRFDLGIPIDKTTGYADWSSWSARLDDSDLDNRAEQMQANNQYVYAIEAWEMLPTGAQYTYIVANRVIDGPTMYPWKRLPFHVLDDHLPTYQHGKATAEVMIPINAAYDNMIDRQQEIINFEAGPRYIGIGFGDSTEGVDIPRPFELLPLADGKMIQQLDTRVDFFPSISHGNELREAGYKATGLTPIAWGMSPNAQTSGRAMSAEWRAVELPLTGKLINISPEIKELIQSWWDYAESYDDKAHKVAAGYRNFKVLWKPLDIRDRTETTMDLGNRLDHQMIDPETAIEESGYENVAEMVAKIRAYLLDPVWNPLGYSRILTLQQLEVQIRTAQLQLAQQEAAAKQQGIQAGGGEATPGSQLPGSNQLIEGGQVPSTAPAVPGGPAQNQPGQTPTGGLPGAKSSMLMRGPMEGGVGVQTVVPVGPQPRKGA